MPINKIVHYILMTLLLAAGIMLAVVALQPEWRLSFQKFFQGKERVVLSSVRGRFIENESPLKAVKAIDHTGVFIEVFHESADGSLELLTRINTGHPSDGQFNFKGQISRLVASDIDGDGMDELLVPTFDEHYQPRLNVYKYQPEMKVFQSINPPVH